MKKILFLLLNILTIQFAIANKYFVSNSGNDDNDGGSPSSAIASIKKFVEVMEPGDSLFLFGGETHSGSIVANHSLRLDSYGPGRAIVFSNQSSAIIINDANDITIKNIICKGAGYKLTSISTSGICLNVSAAAVANYKNITIDNVDVSGYGHAGIYIAADSLFGFENVSITNSDFHENGISGLYINGSWDDIGLIRMTHKNIYVGRCKAFSNHGRPDFKNNWSGSGILVAGVVKGLVEYCEAWENGKDNAATAGGPVGIWTDDSKFVTIQKSVSHHNRGGTTRIDGGGFDIDGGSFGCVIQDCDSYENEGAGFGLFNWETKNIWSNDTIRNCTSTNDGKNPRYGAFSFWSAGSKYPLINCEIYGNRIYKNSGAMITYLGGTYVNINIHDNEFCLTTTPALFATTTPGGVTLTNNGNSCLVLSIDTTSPVRPPVAISAGTKLKAFPNPASTGITISIEVSRGRYELQIIDVNGRIVASNPVVITGQKNIFLNLANYKKGAYLIALKSEYGVKAKTTIIKQ